MDTSNWKEIKPDIKDFFPAKGHELEEGEERTGKYIELREKFASSESCLYVLEQEDGSLVGVWGAKQLDDKMRSLNIGAFVNIRFKGKKPLKGGKTLNEYVVVADPETVEEVKEEKRDKDIQSRQQGEDIPRDNDGNPIKEVNEKEFEKDVDADDIPL